MSMKLFILVMLIKIKIIFFVLHYKIIQENTNSEIFLEFIKEINGMVNKSKKYFLIMDNLICYKNDKVIDFLMKSN